ncbi:MAG: response regulator transcription factor [Synergistaceae bacterium]|nr:response regulator transcription factor [Synergistaceae bacterium]
MSGKGTILLVDDNRDILDTMKQWLTMRGYGVLSAPDAKSARGFFSSLVSFDSHRPDLIVLDIILPDGSGLDLCREIRAAADVPVLFLTALGKDDDIVAGLRAGGDDYLPKPFDFNVLEARIEALLRRYARKSPEELDLGNLKLNTESRRAFFGGKDLLLTPKEFAILKLLAQNMNRYIHADEIYKVVWTMEPMDDLRAVRQKIYCIRKKLSQCEGLEAEIESERYGGYRMTIRTPRISRKNDFKNL